MPENTYHTSSHSKFLLQIHLILVCKYRKKLMDILGNDIKNLSFSISQEANFTIKTMEVDKDHIHYLIDYKPKVSVKEIVRKLKSATTVYCWKHYRDFLEQHFWVENTLWSDGYFVCSVGNANAETIKRYIEEQG